MKEDNTCDTNKSRDSLVRIEERNGKLCERSGGGGGASQATKRIENGGLNPNMQFIQSK